MFNVFFKVINSFQKAAGKEITNHEDSFINTALRRDGRNGVGFNHS